MENEKDKPITDRESFPKQDSADRSFVRMVPMIPAEEAAYMDGHGDGYRKAVVDFLFMFIAGLIVLRLVDSLASD